MYSDTFPVSNLTPSQYVVQSQTNRITFGEAENVAGYPLRDFQVFLGSLNNPPRYLTAGKTYTLPPGVYLPGPIKVWIQAVGGATTFFRDEA